VKSINFVMDNGKKDIAYIMNALENYDSLVGTLMRRKLVTYYIPQANKNDTLDQGNDLP
jgi:hypothetical protein